MGLSMAAPTRTRLVIANDDARYRELLAATLSSLPHIDLMGSAANRRGAFDLVVANCADAVLLDVRSASTKRCATAAGEGTMAVQFVHAHLNTAVKEGAR
jgi:chemotaxis response regulator CheB